MLEGKFREFQSWHIYQIYPRSFFDANGDGIGDLKGILSKLDYLADLGINAVWLCPCYKSPNEDNGYDVADYRDIMDEFGTMEDMRALIDGLHARGIRLIMDLVPNHTSSQHRWFQESRKSKDNPYSDYYYWFDTPPNDWQSMFGGSAWEYDELRKQYYLRTYAKGQPDLNWENPAVVKEMQAVVDFWVDMGVDGFRIDVIDQISKDFAGNRNCFGPRLHEFIHALFGREKTRHLFTVGECWADDIEEVRRHAAPEREELSTLFQFDHQDVGRKDKFTPLEQPLDALWQRLLGWEERMQENGLLYSLFTDNHDNNWLLSRMGDQAQLRYESATCIAAMVYLLRGVCFIYQGQELGMVGSHHDSIEDFRDVESLNLYPLLCRSMDAAQALEGINFGGRDNTRRPFCWDGTTHAGFTSGTPWIPEHSEYRQINLQKDLASERSVWRFYRDLLHLRSSCPVLTEGTFENAAPGSCGFCAYRRKLAGKSVLVVCNFSEAQEICLEEARGKLLLSNYGLQEKTDSSYRPYEIAVFADSTES